MQGDLDTGHWQLATTDAGGDYMQWVPNMPHDLGISSGNYDTGQFNLEDSSGRSFTYDANTNTLNELNTRPVPTTYDPNSLKTNWQGYKYFNLAPEGNYIGETYYIDPATNKPVRADQPFVNSPFLEIDPRTRGGGGFMDKVGDWTASNGWMIPAAMIAAGAGAALGGAGAAGEAGGAASQAGGVAGELAGPTYGELGYTGVEGGMAGPTYGELGYTGLNNAEAIAAADAASKGLTGADALKYVNQARQGLGVANTLAKLLGGGTSGGKSGTTGNLDLSKLANLLGGGQQTNSFIGQIKGNQNPFLFTPPGQTTASEGMYDVSGSNMANALRKA